MKKSIEVEAALRLAQEAIEHLSHNARKAGVEMGLAFVVADEAITAIKEALMSVPDGAQPSLMYKPLTLGQKQRLWSSLGHKPTLKDRVNAYGRAIEEAHGITDKEQPVTEPHKQSTTCGEPVAWVHLKPWLEDGDWPDDCFSHIPRSGWTPLYISPVNSQPLTDEDIFALENSVPDAVVSDRDWCIYFARAIEAAHGIKEQP